MDSLTEVRALISNIDKRIDANRRAAPADRHERECALFRERGLAQLRRAELVEEAATRLARASRPRMGKKCASCGGSGFAKVPA